MLLLDYWLHSGVIDRLAVCFIFSIKSQRPWRLTKGNAEMRNMSKKTWKLRVWSYMTEMQKLDILLRFRILMDVVGRRWTDRTVKSIFRADDTMVVSKSLHMMLLEIVSGMAFGVGFLWL